MGTQKRSLRQSIAAALIGVLLVIGVGSVFFFAERIDLADLRLALSGPVNTYDGPTREVVDSSGRTVEIPEEPSRIAAMDSFSGNVAVLIGAGDRLMGVPGGVRSNILLQEIYPELESLQRLSGSSINIEEMMTVGADLALVRPSMIEAQGEIRKLERMGIPYVVVSYDTLEEQMEAIELVGEVIGGDAEQRASRIVETYREALEIVDSKAAQIPEGDRITVYHSNNDPLTTDGTGSIGAEWITRVGAINVSTDDAPNASRGDHNTTLEQVYVWNPDWIIASRASAVTEIESDPQWGELAAVKDGKVIALPVSTSRWGQRGDPETFFAMLWLGDLIYPELYEDFDLKEFVTTYYSDVIGLEIDDELWEQILTGEGIRIDGTGDNRTR